jgi:predicted nucleic-acid-binding protein
MIGLDTNILARFFGQDHNVQSPKAMAIMGGLTPEEPGWVPLVSLLELVWVLKSNFNLNRAGIARVLDDLLSRDQIVIENADLIYRALHQYRRGSADFADYLIALSSQDAGCAKTLTFDQDAAKTAGMTLIS